MTLRMDSALWLRLAAGLIAIGAAVWVASATEWVEIDVPLPARGEAAKNPLHATQQLARRLGATVTTPTTLSQMPPANATLMLTSWHWDLFPERAARLRNWVEGGGHLVLYADNLDHKLLKEWLPISQPPPPKAEETDESDGEDETESPPGAAGTEPSASGPPLAALRRFEPPCVDAVESYTQGPAYVDGNRYFKICSHSASGMALRTRAPALWALEGPKGALMLRAAHERGQVTVIQPGSLFDNTGVLKGDNALAAMAALQVRRGAQLWFVTEESRVPLPAWLWQQAWVAALFGAAALLLALWRGLRRFGPLAPVAVPGRRSMAEQIAGTARFLRRDGPEALLVAQIRALDTAARLHVRRYDALGRTERAAAIAQFTGLAAATLGLAMDPKLAKRRTDLPATLALLETARRLLVQRVPGPPTTLAHKHPT